MQWLGEYMRLNFIINRRLHLFYVYEQFYKNTRLIFAPNLRTN